MPACCPIELDDASGLDRHGAEVMADLRTGKNGRHRLVGLLRQSVYLEGTPATRMCTDADRLSRGSSMGWLVGEWSITGFAASASQMGRFETS
jgi:hypothetical protein